MKTGAMFWDRIFYGSLDWRIPEKNTLSLEGDGSSDHCLSVFLYSPSDCQEPKTFDKVQGE